MSTNNTTIINNQGGGAAGGILLGGGANSDFALDIVIYISATAASIVVIVLSVYILSVVCDKYCCCFPWFIPVGDHAQEFDHGPIARKAGLWGLRRNERTDILERILEGKKYSEEMSGSFKKHNKNSTEAKGKTKEELVESESDVHLERSSEHNKSISMTEPRHSYEDTALEMDDAEHDTTCAICLNDYEKGEQVLTGRNCNHMFHKSCAFEWLEKHDHCPYCRREMVSPEEMKDMAYLVLGKERVNQMLQWAASTQARAVPAQNASPATSTIATVEPSLPEAAVRPTESVDDAVPDLEAQNDSTNSNEEKASSSVELLPERTLAWQNESSEEGMKTASTDEEQGFVEGTIGSQREDASGIEEVTEIDSVLAALSDEGGQEQEDAQVQDEGTPSIP